MPMDSNLCAWTQHSLAELSWSCNCGLRTATVSANWNPRFKSIHGQVSKFLAAQICCKWKVKARDLCSSNCCSLASHLCVSALPEVLVGEALQTVAALPLIWLIGVVDTYYYQCPSRHRWSGWRLSSIKGGRWSRILECLACQLLNWCSGNLQISRLSQNLMDGCHMWTFVCLHQQAKLYTEHFSTVTCMPVNKKVECFFSQERTCNLSRK